MSVVLAMIVKNEAHVIRECLESVTSFIDSYCIVDTGSTDGTIDVITTFFDDKEIPGVVHQREWLNFGANRSECLELARSEGEYAFVIDADDVVCGSPDLSTLTADSYFVQVKSGSLTYWRQQIFSSRVNWRYEGVLHEYPVCDETEVLTARADSSWWVESRRLGDRSKVADKYERDAAILLDDLSKNPTNERSMFYLAQSYFDAGRYSDALAAYARRVAMGGWAEEVFYSKMRLGECLRLLERPRHETVEALLDAWEFRPTRAEPLHALAKWHRELGMFAQASMFARAGLRVAFPESEILFVESDVYLWRLKDELAVSTFFLGRFQESLELCAELLRSTILPTEERPRIEQNLRLSIQRLSDSQSERGK